MNNINNYICQSDLDIAKRIQIKTGRSIWLLPSQKCYEVYQLYPGARIETKKGIGTVEGIDEGHRLWIKLDFDSEATYWDDIHSRNDLVNKGFKVLSNPLLILNVPIQNNFEHLKKLSNKEHWWKEVKRYLLDPSPSAIKNLLNWAINYPQNECLVYFLKQMAGNGFDELFENMKPKNELVKEFIELLYRGCKDQFLSITAKGTIFDTILTMSGHKLALFFLQAGQCTCLPFDVVLNPVILNHRNSEGNLPVDMLVAFILKKGELGGGTYDVIFNFLSEMLARGNFCSQATQKEVEKVLSQFPKSPDFAYFMNLQMLLHSFDPDPNKGSLSGEIGRKQEMSLRHFLQIATEIDAEDWLKNLGDNFLRAKNDIGQNFPMYFAERLSTRMSPVIQWIFFWNSIGKEMPKPRARALVILYKSFFNSKLNLVDPDKMGRNFLHYIFSPSSIITLCHLAKAKMWEIDDLLVFIQFFPKERINQLDKLNRTPLDQFIAAFFTVFKAGSPDNNDNLLYAFSSILKTLIEQGAQPAAKINEASQLVSFYQECYNSSEKKGSFFKELKILELLATWKFLNSNSSSSTPVPFASKEQEMEVEAADKGDEIEQIMREIGYLPQEQEAQVTHSPFIQESFYLRAHFLELSVKEMKRASQLYQQLAVSIVNAWNTHAIQPNLRRLMGQPSVKRQIDLAQARDSDGVLDGAGIRAILRPFYDFYHHSNSSQNIIVQAVIQDAICALHLCFSSNKEELMEALKPFGECASFLASQLAHQSQNREIQDFMKNQQIHELVFENQEASKHVVAIRDLLFYLNLKEMEIRAKNLQEAIRIENSSAASLTQKPAVLHYAVNNRSFAYPLTVVKKNPSGSIQAIGEDSVNQTKEKLKDLFSFDGKALSVEQLEQLQAYYQKNQKEFYLFSPLPSNLLKTHEGQISDLEQDKMLIDSDPISEEDENEEVILEKKSVKRRLEEKEEKAFKSLRLELPSVEKNQKPIASQAPKDHFGHLRIAADSFNLLSTSAPRKEGKEEVDSDDESTSSKRTRSFSEHLGTYQKMQIEKETNDNSQCSNANDIPLATFDVDTKLMQNPTDASSPFEGTLLESMIHSLCEKTIQRIHFIKEVSQLGQFETILSKTKEIRKLLSSALSFLPALSFDDQELKPYQQKTLEWLSQLTSKQMGAIVAYAPGLGKTKVAIGKIRQTQKESNRPILVVVPPSLVPQWIETFFKQIFIARKNYYSSLMKSYPQLTLSQRNHLEKGIKTLIQSQYSQLENCDKRMVKNNKKIEEINQSLKESEHKLEKTQEIDQKAKELKKKLKILHQRRVDLEREKQILQTRAKESEALMQEALQYGYFDLFIRLWNASPKENSAQEWIAQLTDQVPFEKFAKAKEHLKHLKFKTVHEDKDLPKAILSALALVGDFPLLQKQFSSFLLTLVGRENQNVPMPEKETITLDDSLLENDMYEQMIHCSSKDRHLPSFDPKQPSTWWKVVITTPYTIESFKNHASSLADLKKLPWIKMIIDEVHEWVWNFSNPQELEHKQKVKAIKETIESLNQQHQTEPLLLTGTPYVNSYFDVLSLLKLSNPSLDFSGLAEILKNRQAVLNNCLSNLLKNGKDEQLLLTLEKALAEWLIAVEHARALQNHLMKVHTQVEESIRKDWTIKDGKVLLPKAERESIQIPLAAKQKEVYQRELQVNNVLKDEANLAKLLFHPIFLNEWKHKNLQEIKQAIKQMNQQEIEQFIEHSSFLNYVFKNEKVKASLAKGERMLFFLPEKKFALVLKMLFARYFKDVKVKCYNGDQEPEIRASIVNDFEDPSSKTRVMILTPKAGGVGLNLPSAHFVFDMAPWWNSAMKEQMEARALRAGKEETTFIYSFDFGTTLEYHKSDIAKTKEKWKKAFLSKESSDQVIPQFIEALILDLVNASRNGSNLEAVKKETEAAHNQLKDILEEPIQNLLLLLRDPTSSFAQQLKKACQIEQMDSINDLQPRNISLPKKVQSGELSLQLLPLPVNDSASATFMAHKLMKHKPFVTDLLRHLNSLTESEWIQLLNRPQEFISQRSHKGTWDFIQNVSNFLATPQNQNQSQNQEVRWFRLDDHNGQGECKVTLAQPQQSAKEGTPRLLEMDTPQGKRYLLLIKTEVPKG